MAAKPFTTTAVLAGLVVAGIYSIIDLPRRNGLQGLLDELRALHGWPLPDAPDKPGLTRFVNIGPVDYVLTVLVRVFWPCVNGNHPALSLLSLLFCGQVLSLHTVIMLEGLRKGNKLTVLWASTVWAQVYQLIPAGVTVPVWGLVHLWRSPVSRLAAQPGAVQKADLLTMDANKLLAYPFSLVMGFAVPTALAAWPGLLGDGTLQVVLALWQFFPFWVALWQFDILVFISPYDLVPSATYKSAVANLRFANWTYGAVLTLTAAAHLITLGYVFFPEHLLGLFPGLDVSSVSVAGVLAPPSVSSPAQVRDIAEGVLAILQYDMYFSTGSVLVWSLYQTYALENNISAALGAAIRSVYRTVLVGPAGAALWNIWDRDTRARQAAAAADPKKNE